MHQEVAVNFWRRALEEEIGIALEVNDPDVFVIKNQLYEARQLARDSRLNDLIIISPKPENTGGKTEIWICKKATEL